MPNTAARRTSRHSVVILHAAGTLALATLIGWALEVDMLTHRPQLTLMVYLLLLATAMGACIVWAIARTQLAIADAFAAGVRVGQRAPTPPRAIPPSIPQQPRLTVVVE